MKYFISILVFFIVISFGIINVSADTITQDSSVATYRHKMGDKAAGGAENILFGWTEIPKRIATLTKESKNPFWGVLAGTFQGTVKAMARTFSGATDVATAGINPDGPSLMNPDIKVE